MLIQACLNGSRRPAEHPALPLTPADLARDAERVLATGAGALHIHPRSADGQESLAPEDQAAAILAIRDRCPGLPIGVSTGLWIEPDRSRRLQRIQQWTILPDFASVNFSEPGAAELCSLLLLRGIDVEAGLATVMDAQRLLELDLADRCLRILIEPGEEAADLALVTAEQIIHCLDIASIRRPRLLHGYGAATWPVLWAALQRGYDTRIGLEDTLTMPDGSLAKDNAALVSLAIRQACQIGLLRSSSD